MYLCVSLLQIHAEKPFLYSRNVGLSQEASKKTEIIFYLPHRLVVHFNLKTCSKN